MFFFIVIFLCLCACMKKLSSVSLPCKKKKNKNLCVSSSKLKKLSEDSLTKQPEEVFDVLEKLGEG